MDESVDSQAEAAARQARAIRQAVTVTAYPHGPYLLRGSFTLRDEAGQELPHSSATVALCRCGRSRQKPFCDGSHEGAYVRSASGRSTTRRPGCRAISAL